MAARIKVTEKFIEDPLVKTWYNKLMQGSNNTAAFYAYHLYRFLDKRHETPKEFLAHSKSMKESELWIELRNQVFDGSIPNGSIKQVIKSFRSFLIHHGVFLPAERLSIRSDDNDDVKDLTMAEVREIINHCKEPFKTIYTIFTYAPMGEVSFSKWNSRPDMAKDVKGQLATKSPCIKVIHPPRKNAKRKFYSLIPRHVIEAYLKKQYTLPFKNQVGNLITDNNLQTEWRAARKRAGFIGEPGEPNPWKGVGCHEIRDTWFTFAQTQGCAWDVAQFTIGHTQFSEQGYNKVWTNEKHVWEETSKANFASQVSREDLESRDQQLKAQDERIKYLGAATRELAERQLAEAEERLETMEDRVAREHKVTPETEDPNDYGIPRQSDIDQRRKEIDKLRKLLASLLDN